MVLTFSSQTNAIPENLQKAYEDIKSQLTISPETMRSISAHFVDELEKGLSKKGGNIPMIPGWVMDFPTGKETGNYLALDFGGTNVRVVNVALLGDSKFTFQYDKFSIPDEIRVGKSEDLWDFIANGVGKFVEKEFKDVKIEKKLAMGFTFSYPASQNAINHGVLQRWTKGFDVDDVEGHDVVPLLQKALDDKNIPVEVSALINDTTGTLVASMYTHPDTIMGLIFGTGVNGAYYDEARNIPKLEGKLPSDIDQDGIPMAINCEYGAFDNEHLYLPRTKYDIQIDQESPRPGQQTYEKMIAGYYLGEVLRLILLEWYEAGLVFKGQDITPLEKAFAMDTSYPSRIEEHGPSYVGELFKESFQLELTSAEQQVIHDVCILIGTRAARLSIIGVSGIIKKRNYTSGKLAADGSVFNRYPNFKERATRGLIDILGGDEATFPFEFVHAEDGSGVGAAIIACLSQNRILAGNSVGTK